jgi:anthranilate synthase component 1
MILDRFPDRKQFTDLARTANVIPVCASILADMETPVSILHKFFRRDKESFLLESVEGGERWGRYSFLGLSAFGTIKIFSREVEIKTGNHINKIFHNDHPLEVMRSFAAKFIPAQIRELPRFWNGFTGYFTYEMVRFFEKINVSLPPDTPYAHFIIPDEMIIFDNIKQTMTCLEICYLQDEDDAGSAFDKAVTRLETMIRTLDTPFTAKPWFNPGKKACLTPETPADDYIKGVEKIKKHIIEGDIFQAVFSRRFSCRTDADPVMLYRAQRYINPSPYMFFMNFTDLAIAGSSPETMVRLESSTATLRPIAGTRPRGATQQQDRSLSNELLNDEKEKAEHVMLIDLGRNDLGRVAEPGTVQVTDTMVVERYSHVMHLVSNITCDLRENCDAYDLFKATFPAGTLSGAPKIRAMEIISRLEKHPRRVYGGAAGYISFNGNMDFAITIRTAVMENDKITIQAGAGIVYDSDPQSELEECSNKAKSVEHALMLALGNKNGGR